MSEPTAPSSAQRAAHVAAFGLLYALAAAVARTVLARPMGGADGLDPAYFAGALVALPFDTLLGCLIAFPIGRRPNAFGARVISGVPAIVLLALHVAVTPRLPGAVTGTQLEVAGLPALGAGLMLGAAVLAGVTPLAARLVARYEKRAGRVADAVALGLLACLGVGASVGAYGDLYAGAVHPLWHLALQPEGRETPAADPAPARHQHDHENHEHGEHGAGGQLRYGPNDRIIDLHDPPSTDGRPPAELRAMQAILHQGDALEPVPDPAYPYCAEEVRAAEPPAAGEALPSVIVVLLRDVGMRELQLDQPDGSPQMPMLRRLAAEAVLFDDVMAAGEDDADVLLALLSGQPPSPDSPVLLDPALPYLPGVARDLRGRGYRTAYFDGVRDDRTFRDSYLRMVGFERIDAPPLGGSLLRPDEETYARLEAWFAEPSSPTEPRFAMVHGFGHSAETIAAANVTDDIESLRRRLSYVDQQFEALYTWYQREQRARGTVLLVMGDHPSPIALPGDPETPTTGAGHELFFRVPLFVAGLPAEAETALRERSSRLGAQTDFPRTLLGLAHDDRVGCYFGRDLFADGDWPLRRAPLSIGGDSRQFLVAHDGDTRWLYNMSTQTVRIHDRARDPRLERDLFSEDDPEWPRIREYLLSYLITQRYVRRERHYMPVPDVPESARPPRTQPRRISDRGLLNGPPADGDTPLRQSHADVEAAAEAGFESILLDIFMNRERELLSIGSGRLLQLGEGVEVNVEDATREQLELLGRSAPTVEELLRTHPRMRFVFHVHAPVRPHLRTFWIEAVVRTFAALSAERVMLMTSDPVAAGVFRGDLRALRDAQDTQDPPVPVALSEAPDNVAGAYAWLQTARALELSWLFLPPAVVNPALLETAHRWGVRVGLTGVTGPSGVLRLSSGAHAPSGYIASRPFLLTAPSPSAPTP